MTTQEKIKLIWSRLDEDSDSDGEKYLSLTPDDLSRACARLSVLLVNLGEEWADAKKNADLNELEYKLKIEKAKLDYRNTGMSATDSESKSKLDCGDMTRSAILSQYKANQLKVLYDDTERLISVMQTRLRVLMTEMSNNLRAD